MMVHDDSQEGDAPMESPAAVVVGVAVTTPEVTAPEVTAPESITSDAGDIATPTATTITASEQELLEFVATQF